MMNSVHLIKRYMILKPRSVSLLMLPSDEMDVIRERKMTGPVTPAIRASRTELMGSANPSTRKERILSGKRRQTRPQITPSTMAQNIGCLAQLSGFLMEGIFWGFTAEYKVIMILLCNLLYVMNADSSLKKSCLTYSEMLSMPSSSSDRGLKLGP